MNTIYSRIRNSNFLCKKLRVKSIIFLASLWYFLHNLDWIRQNLNFISILKRTTQTILPSSFVIRKVKSLQKTYEMWRSKKHSHKISCQIHQTLGTTRDYLHHVRYEKATNSIIRLEDTSKSELGKLKQFSKFIKLKRERSEIRKVSRHIHTQRGLISERICSMLQRGNKRQRHRNPPAIQFPWIIEWMKSNGKSSSSYFLPLLSRQTTQFMPSTWYP